MTELQLTTELPALSPDIPVDDVPESPLLSDPDSRTGTRTDRETGKMYRLAWGPHKETTHWEASPDGFRAGGSSTREVTGWYCPNGLAAPVIGNDEAARAEYAREMDAYHASMERNRAAMEAWYAECNAVYTRNRKAARQFRADLRRRADAGR